MLNYTASFFLYLMSGILSYEMNFFHQHYLDPPKKLSKALSSKGIPQATFHTIKHGETVVVKKENSS